MLTNIVVQKTGNGFRGNIVAYLPGGDRAIDKGINLFNRGFGMYGDGELFVAFVNVTTTGRRVVKTTYLYDPKDAGAYTWLGSGVHSTPPAAALVSVPKPRKAPLPAVLPMPETTVEKGKVAPVNTPSVR